jgi:hypothetical protein
MSDDRNGSHPSLHPEALQALAEETANRQAADERWIQRVESGVEEVRASLEGFRSGTTDWQQSVTRQLQRLTDQLQVVMIARLVWPSVTVLMTFALGGFCAEIVWRLTTSH